MGGILIGDVAERTGVTAPTIRYYESIGLLKTPSRSTAGYRRYSERTVNELRFIRKAQALGFALNEITEILKLSRSGQKPCGRVLSLTHRHLEAVDVRIRQLQHFREYLARELAKWNQQQTATTSDGLCEFIAASEPEATAVTMNAGDPERARTKRQTGRGS